MDDSTWHEPAATVIAVAMVLAIIVSAWRHKRWLRRLSDDREKDRDFEKRWDESQARVAKEDGWYDDDGESLSADDAD